MPQTLFINNLPSHTTDAELATIFSRHGRVLKAWINPSKIASKSPSARTHRHGTVSGVVEVHPDDFEQMSWVMAGSWYKNKCLDVQTEAMRRQGNSQTRERAIYTDTRY